MKFDRIDPDPNQIRSVCKVFTRSDLEVNLNPIRCSPLTSVAPLMYSKISPKTISIIKAFQLSFILFFFKRTYIYAVYMLASEFEV